MAKAIVKGFYDKDTNTITYVVSCPNTKVAAIIDSVLEFQTNGGKTTCKPMEPVIAYVKEQGLKVEWVLETHAHADHITGAPYLRSLFGAQLAIGALITQVQKTFAGILNNPELKSDGSQFDHLFKPGEKFRIGELEVEVLHTPGHTPACSSYYIANDCVFVGDVIFMPDQGTARCDFPGGSAEALWDSLQKILSLPEAVRVFTCHDYQPGGREVKWETTVGEQKKSNIHCNSSITREQFLKVRTERDKTLTPPRLIIPSIQVNINAGFFPEPQSNGSIYLKWPVNVLDKDPNQSGVLNLHQNGQQKL